MAPNRKSGAVGECFADFLFGGIIALHADDSFAWQRDYGDQEGTVRASAAVGDIDGDGQLEVVLQCAVTVGFTPTTVLAARWNGNCSSAHERKTRRPLAT